jgi:hypothetical protein
MLWIDWMLLDNGKEARRCLSGALQVVVILVQIDGISSDSKRSNHGR